MLPRKIYIGGGYANQTIYFDTKKKIAVRSVQDKRWSQKQKIIFYIISAILVPITIIQTLPLLQRHYHGGGRPKFHFPFMYTPTLVFFLILLWIIEFLWVATFVHHQIYSGVKNVEPATRDEFRRAYRQNWIWRKEKKRRVTAANYRSAYYLILVSGFLGLAFPIILPIINADGALIGNYVGTEIFAISMGGYLFYGFYAMIWQNNPWRFYRAVEMFQKKQLVFPAEIKIKNNDSQVELSVTSQKILPLGSVVTLADSDQPLLIVARGTIGEESDPGHYFDYGGVAIPEGQHTVDGHHYFNRENVQSVLFEGYVDDKERYFADRYEQEMKQSKLTKSVIDL